MGSVEKTFKNGEVIVKEGDTGKSFFQLVDGSAYAPSIPACNGVRIGPKDNIATPKKAKPAHEAIKTILVE